MKDVTDSLKSGNWRALVACFLYFGSGFTAWVLFGPLAPFIARTIKMTAAEQGFLVAVPVLSAAILRVPLGNLYQSADGRAIALFGVGLCAIPTVVLPLMPFEPTYGALLVLGVLLGVGGASFSVALPMAGSNYPPQVQGLVLGIAAAGNIGAVLDGFFLPPLATHFGWRIAVGAAFPVLAVSALALYVWSSDASPKSGSAARAFAGLVLTLFGLIAIALLFDAGFLGGGGARVLLMPVFGVALAVAVLPRQARAVLIERDAWVMMLVYGITFGGFVGMSSYVSLLLMNLYQFSTIEAGFVMALLAATGALARPLGGLIADKVSGVHALLVLLAAIAVADLAFAAAIPPVAAGIALLTGLYLAFGLGNGALFQLVPHRWRGRTGLMSGIVGAAGGIGGFYLPVAMGLAKQSTGSYQMGFATFGSLAAFAFVALLMLRKSWMAWATPPESIDRPALVSNAG
ncbi:MFS transporter [Pararobbsia silviterrae]|uniref:MFS transporter n=1 Tax=Pararobbsia silviterrae TaxID=1792498 RepID=A0A494Y0C5_9BURK|nr:MFS transporter [Pararobbsia silviterrae]RKP53283.1 MFS transporter [Pararobbsia silviterrae]